MSWEEMLHREKVERLLMEALEATPVEQVMPKGEVLLVCGHRLQFDTGVPHKREVLWCNSCKEEREIDLIGTGKAFRVKCQTCNYTRGKGGRIEADRAAVSHRLKKPHHAVDILNAAGTAIHTFQDDENVTLKLPEEPPF